MEERGNRVREMERKEVKESGVKERKREKKYY